jgi:hypothetical protein
MAPSSEDESRAPTHRLATTRLRIVDGNGRSLPDTEIPVRQTRQAFL